MEGCSKESIWVDEWKAGRRVNEGGCGRSKKKRKEVEERRMEEEKDSVKLFRGDYV